LCGLQSAHKFRRRLDRILPGSHHAAPGARFLHSLVNQRFNLLFGHVNEGPGELFPHLAELLIQLSDALDGRVSDALGISGGLKTVNTIAINEVSGGLWRLLQQQRQQLRC
jgi:hypothetical protein